MLGVESLFFGGEDKPLVALPADELLRLIALCVRHHCLPAAGNDTRLFADTPVAAHKRLCDTPATTKKASPTATAETGFSQERVLDTPATTMEISSLISIVVFRGQRLQGAFLRGGSALVERIRHDSESHSVNPVRTA